jgi:RNA polymerase sigma factor CnrH
LTGGEEPLDESLVRRAIAGDAQAFASIVARYKSPLYRFVRRYVHDADEAYDLLQQAYVAAWLSLSRYDTRRSMRTWLQTIALNKCRDHARKLKVRRLFVAIGLTDQLANVADRRPSVEDALLADEEQRALATAIADLPRQLKEPLLLTVFGGCSQSEVGYQLGISVKAVETRVARARRRLADALRERSIGSGNDGL